MIDKGRTWYAMISRLHSLNTATLHYSTTVYPEVEGQVFTVQCYNISYFVGVLDFARTACLPCAMDGGRARTLVGSEWNCYKWLRVVEMLLPSDMIRING